ncbi:MAG: chitobiase/beta-hexosaminidase C-terminal domain-containing protein [Firmicutes bacterium]|nr:chitobiase/beta-hexosaminidase C-terminal domain-containing protein [Bacillota bacterium]MCM1401206.1 chitobiase/beta-hexosaminidase C-terminal domain-containing protein [Bacteroides sp.]MCM1477097.1 chitobiase/beta-hexosaminidase C-terminal domain-containing protein [Bacteroides sp.]
MKKLLLSLLFIAGCVSMASALEVKFDFENNTYGLTRQTENNAPYIDNGTVVKNGDAQITLNKNPEKNGSRLWSDGLRFYKNSEASMTIAVPGGEMTKVVLTYASGATFELAEDATGTYENGTWTGASEDVILNYSAAANKALKTVTITYSKEGGSTVEPTPEPVEPGETVASNIADFLAKAPAKGNVATMNGDVTVVYVNAANGYTYVKDATGATLIYSRNLPYSVGDIIPGGWEGTVDIFNGLYEIKPNGTMPAAKGTTTVTYTNVTAAPTADMVNQVVVLKNVVFESATPSAKSNFTGTMGGTSVAFRNNFTIADTPAGTYDVFGAIAIYNNNVQVYPIEYRTDGPVKETVATPEFSVNGGMVEEGTSVAITCATSGASIHYTVDGTEPTETSELYTSPLSITDNITIKAIAVKTDMNNSAVASVSYVIKREGQQNVTFDFTNISSLTPSFDPTAAPETDNSNKYYNIDNTELYAGPVTFVAKATDESDKGTATRLYVRTSDMQLRIYKKNQFTLSTSKGYVLEKIVINYNNTASIPLADGQKGTYAYADKVGTWTSSNDKVSAVTFAIPADGSNSQINSIEVICNQDLSAIESVAVDNSNAPVEYFNLQGVRVDADNMVPGIYVRRQGTEVTKILVK